ncbi:hypothetical protein [Kordiimonas sp. SCSIO 12610]|uniref:hypothetical protein n=1 Tax=Kordiimonas sp. SCSIO 12610 TaxID=2829597 RepID=UPI00210C2C72|nr:hypothetical protein [Kordiimonas sp. SCSIO 12610]UTW56162.1 hypothetical protein KFF44_04500 [Kordiimonas sp. SCSIO 12610]
MMADSDQQNGTPDDAVDIVLEKLIQERAKKGIVERITAITAFVAAIGAFATAIVSIATALETRSSQDDLAATQARLDAQQIKLDTNDYKINENARIVRLYRAQGRGCSTIPFDEIARWNRYSMCMGVAEDFDQFKTIDDQTRLMCLEQHSYCDAKPTDSDQSQN